MMMGQNSETCLYLDLMECTGISVICFFIFPFPSIASLCGFLFVQVCVAFVFCLLFSDLIAFHAFHKHDTSRLKCQFTTTDFSCICTCPCTYFLMELVLLCQFTHAPMVNLAHARSANTADGGQQVPVHLQISKLYTHMNYVCPVKEAFTAMLTSEQSIGRHGPLNYHCEGAVGYFQKIEI